MSFDLIKFGKRYGYEIEDKSKENQFYDYIVFCNHRPVTIELKERTSFFNDIALEAIQTNKVFCAENHTATVSEVNTSVGWFYKTECNYLVYVMPKDDLYYVYIIRWDLFKAFVNKHLSQFSLIYSDKTTGSYNYVVPISMIPQSLYKIRRVKISDYTIKEG